MYRYVISLIVSLLFTCAAFCDTVSFFFSSSCDTLRAGKVVCPNGNDKKMIFIYVNNRMSDSEENYEYYSELTDKLVNEGISCCYYDNRPVMPKDSTLHTSLFDILAIVAVHPNLTIIAQNWVFSNPFFAATARMAGFLSVARGFETIMPILEQEIRDGASVLVFPEGGRSQLGTLRRFHRGAFYLAQQMNIPVQPVLIKGCFNLMSKGELIIGKSRITLTVLPQINLETGQWGGTYQEITRNVYQYYAKLLNV